MDIEGAEGLLRILDPRTTHVWRDGIGDLILEMCDEAGETVRHEHICPVRAFPLTAADEFITFFTEENEYLGVLESLRQVDERTEELLREELEHRYFLPQITSISFLRINAGIIQWRVETDRGGTSYTIDTARELARLYPGSELHFILGSDSLLELHLWKDIPALLEICRFVTLARPGAEYDSLIGADLRLPDPWPERLKQRIRIGHTVSISSTDIRYRVAEGLAIRYLVHPAVEMYIAEHSLYRS